MKKLGLGLLVLGASFFNVTIAKADFVKGRVRTVQEAKNLDQIDEDGKVIGVGETSLTGQAMDGKADLVSFDLTVKVQPKCFRAPCPSFNVTRHYRVIAVDHESKHVTTYTANEVPKNIAAQAFVGRKLIVTENDKTGEIQITDSFRQHPSDFQMYEGTFEELAVTL